MSSKTIIFSTIGFLLLSFMFLSAMEMKQADLKDKDVWMIYFADPKNNSTDFIIENHSQKTDFHFEISADKTNIRSDDVEVSNGAAKIIRISPNDTAGKKITIDVTGDGGTKEIYKSL